MVKTGSIDLPLHFGKCPRWLFKRMKKLSGEIIFAIIDEYGTKELLFRLSNPLFFQALGCVLGFDWHSSGLTTTVSAALKEGSGNESGIAFCGGKGKTSRKTPEEIEFKANEFGFSDKKIETLIKATRLSAKVDNSCIQDGYQLYHHLFVFDEDGNWAVIQQGLNEDSGYARRYHWFNSDSFVDSPKESIIGIKKHNVLNLVSDKSREVRKTSVDIVKDNPVHLKNELNSQQTLFGHFVMPQRHEILSLDINERDWKILHEIYEQQPKDYEELVSLKGVGGKTLRSLALLSKIIYGCEADWEDPIKYSFAHGGKDGIPYPVDKKNYDSSIEFLRNLIEERKIGGERYKETLRRLATFF
ncbi:MAG: DUF763 domain-containing protein [Candidatus Bilamarchaeaceae archaeon]